MDLKKYTNKAQEAVLGAHSLASEFGHPSLEPLHLLIALMQQQDGVAPEVIAKIGARPAALLSELENILEGRPRVSGSNADITLSRPAQQVFARAEREAGKMRDEYVGTEHLL